MCFNIGFGVPVQGTESAASGEYLKLCISACWAASLQSTSGGSEIRGAASSMDVSCAQCGQQKVRVVDNELIILSFR